MKINVKNFHIAKVTEQDGALVYEKPIPIPGLEQVSRAPQISSGSKYGDGIVRFKVSKKEDILRWIIVGNSRKTAIRILANKFELSYPRAESLYMLSKIILEIA